MLVLLLLWSHVVGVVATVGAPQQTDSGPLSCTAAWAGLAAAWRAEPRHPAHTTAEKLGTQAVLLLWLMQHISLEKSSKKPAKLMNRSLNEGGGQDKTK